MSRVALHAAYGSAGQAEAIRGGYYHLVGPPRDGIIAKEIAKGAEDVMTAFIGHDHAKDPESFRANRGDALTIDSGWREIADPALGFVKRFA